MKRKIAILGAGAWGSALAHMNSENGHETWLYGRDSALIKAINTDKRNEKYLGSIPLSPRITAHTDPSLVLKNTDLILVTIPAQSLRDALEMLTPLIPARVPLVLCAKGIERTSGAFMSEVVATLLPDHDFAILSGPSFAEDVARSNPAAVTIAAPDLNKAKSLAYILSSAHFRCYSSDDVIGVEIGGSLKNVLALAAGVAAGRGLGASANAALITRGFAEIRRISASFGAKPHTMAGLSVLGDLILTCSSPQSRNFSYGMALAKGEHTASLKLAEGVATAPIAAKLCADKNINAPIIHTIAMLISGAYSVEDAINALINRPLKEED
ncbi:NAD(P)H-dependent glycerol-3-phosphate dehydrogenase [Bartonella sp. DGB2]|uniref:NAD(P)H-dependent glycerol-3-phosphate dehydrogenase n=1 Tax=Bartonella sp. DGB2 TaxID=3388426 RepID=UPI00398FDC4D